MGSTRLHGKVMADVAGRPLLDHVVKRAQQAQRLSLVTVATSDRPTDDIVARFCAERDMPYFRGSEEDVLDRYYQAAQYFSAKVIVRLTADCPLLDPEVIDRVVQFFQGVPMIMFPMTSNGPTRLGWIRKSSGGRRWSGPGATHA
jgi:spore coat polysaccharide biosynthesis protein SpsF